MDDVLTGVVVRGLGRTIVRALGLVLVGVAVVSVTPVLLEERGLISSVASFWAAGLGIAALLGLVLNEIWMRGAFQLTPDGVVVRYRRMLAKAAHTETVGWGAITSYRFDTDPQGRPVVSLVDARGRDVSLYGHAREDVRFAEFEAAFRGDLDAHVAMHGAGGRPTETPSFYAGRGVAWLAGAGVAAALGLAGFAFARGVAGRYTTLTLVALAVAFALRTWTARRA